MMNSNRAIAKNDIVTCRGFQVRVVSIDHSAGQAVVQLGKRQSIVNISDLKQS